MPVFTDQTGKSIILPAPPRRIVSLVPSQTELLYDLDLRDEVAGITKFCVHPEEWFRSKTRVGGTKKLNIDTIRSLQPDLILANKEENVKQQVEELASSFPVWTSDINDLSSALEMILQIGKMTRREEQALAMNEQIKEEFKKIQTTDNKPQTIYLIWKDPYMTVGGDTFIHSMMEMVGFNNLFDKSSRYPEISDEQLKQLNPEVLLLSSEPFPFQQKHADDLQALLPQTKILLVDGEMFSWYGSRLLKAPSYFEKINRILLRP